jgi:hypothetical protein
MAEQERRLIPPLRGAEFRAALRKEGAAQAKAGRRRRGRRQPPPVTGVRIPPPGKDQP